MLANDAIVLAAVQTLVLGELLSSNALVRERDASRVQSKADGLCASSNGEVRQLQLEGRLHEVDENEDRMAIGAAACTFWT